MPKLSSDILEAQFGPTSVKILLQNEGLRIIQTVTENGRVLETSLVRFLPEGVRAFPEVHAAIRAGQSMGKAFKEHGIKFVRSELFACKYRGVTVVGVTALVGPLKLPYAQITETYISDVVWPKYFGQLTEQAIKDVAYLAELTN